MAIAKFNLPTNMSTLGIWYGDVVAYSNNYIRIDSYDNAQEYTGSQFTYDSYGVTGGTVTGTKGWTSGALQYSITDMNFPAVLLQHYLNQGNAYAIHSFLFSGNDIVHGSYGSDIIYLHSGNDTVAGGDGDDIIDGGAGTDFAKFASTKNSFSIAHSSDMVLVEDLNGSLGTDMLTNVERLIFSDAAYALDTEVGQSAGTAYRIYQAAFDRTPDSSGLSYWLHQIDNGMDLIEVSARFIDSREFRDMYGNAPSNLDFVEKLYQNVLNREGEESGVNYWINQLDSGAKTHAKVLADFSESTENVALVGTTIESGFWYEV